MSLDLKKYIFAYEMLHKTLGQDLFVLIIYLFI